MIRNGWWCPIHGFYSRDRFDITSAGRSWIPLGAVLSYSAPVCITEDQHFFINIPYKVLYIFSVHLFPDTIYYCDARDLEEFESNLPSGLLFNSLKED